MTLDEPPTTRRTEVGAATDVGNIRELNEDTIFAQLIDLDPPHPLGLTAVLLVADGVGGHDAGEVASGLAGETVRQVLVDLSLGAAHTLQERMIEAAAETNTRIHACGGPRGAHPATTLTVCAVRESDYAVIHIGDSRAYLLRGDEARQITEDDSWVADAVRRGQMTAEEAEVSPFRNQITKAVGSAPSVQPGLYEGEWLQGDVMVLTSDGLTEYVAAAEILGAVRCAYNIQEACDTLVQMARERGGHDNISVVAAAFSGPARGARKPPTAPLTALPRAPASAGHKMAPLIIVLLCAAAIVLSADLRSRRPSARPTVQGHQRPTVIIPIKRTGPPPAKNEPSSGWQSHVYPNTNLSQPATEGHRVGGMHPPPRAHLKTQRTTDDG